MDGHYRRASYPEEWKRRGDYGNYDYYGSSNYDRNNPHSLSSQQTTSGCKRRWSSHQEDTSTRLQLQQNTGVPFEQGSVSTLNESKEHGYIRCLTGLRRDEAVYFHSSQANGKAKLEVGDEVQFKVGSSTKGNKLQAYQITRLYPGTVCVGETPEDDGRRRFSKSTSSCHEEERPTKYRQRHSVDGGSSTRVPVEHEKPEHQQWQQQQQQHCNRLPLEQGTIASLGSYRFGFVHCASRDQTFFFHFSEVVGDPLTLKINDAVEFKVVPGRDGAFQANQVRLLQQGTVSWDQHPEAEGRRSSSSGHSVEGTTQQIQQLDCIPFEQGTVYSLKDKYGFVTCAGRDEAIFSHFFEAVNPLKLQVDDKVEFKVGPSEKGNKLQALQVRKLQPGTSTVVMEEHQQQQYDHMPEEQGTICTLWESSRFGFIRSASREEDLFFHYSNAVDSAALKIGDEVGFKVGPSEKGNKLAAFQIRRLLPGTVVMETPDDAGRRFFSGLDERQAQCPRGHSVEEGTAQALVENEKPEKHQQYDHMPEEQGTVYALRESSRFGFIRSASREEDLFFHFSYVVDSVPLRVNDEVEFKVGPSKKGSKLAAFKIRRLRPGTVVWETLEDEGRLFRGRVEEPPRFDPANKHAMIDGTIRVLVETENISEEENGPVFNFTCSDFTPVNKLKQHLSHGDLVEFTISTLHSNQTKYARNIRSVHEELEPELEQAKTQEDERRLLEGATIEYGVVTRVVKKHGFLWSKRRRDVFFRFSDVCASAVLKVGQEVKFLVVEAQHQDTNKRRLPTARKVEILPPGSVNFNAILAHGVTGILTHTPQVSENSIKSLPRGKVRLDDPIHEKDVNGNERIISEVYLTSGDSPGGMSNGASGHACWVQPGDRLLFDVVKDVVDGVCRAAPTKHLVPNDDPQGNDAAAAPPPSKKSSGNGCRVRLIGLALASRSEGTIKTVKRELFGFIYFAERPVDVHFKVSQLLPDALQADIRRNMGLADLDKNGQPLRLKAGTELLFDMSAHSFRNSDGSIQAGVEHLVARRILVLPPETIRKTLLLASGVRGTVCEIDPNENVAGFVDLEKPLQLLSHLDRHPLVAKMIDEYLASPPLTPLVYPDIQSKNEDDVVIAMIDAKAPGKLCWNYLPKAEETNYPGRLCVRKVDEEALTPSDPKVGEIGMIRESWCKAVGVSSADKPDESETTMILEKTTQQKHQKAPDFTTPLRYDQLSLTEQLRNDLSPIIRGDAVQFDVVLCRRTGQLSVQNMSRAPQASEMKITSSGVNGVVKEIFSTRNLGFISVLDERAANREMLVFRLSKVASPEDSRDGSAGKETQLRKGDAVKFDIGVGKNSKRVALNVTIVPATTELENIECTRSNILEPSLTSLASSSRPHVQAGEEERYRRLSDTTSSSASHGPCFFSPDDHNNVQGEWHRHLNVSNSDSVSFPGHDALDRVRFPIDDGHSPHKESRSHDSSPHQESSCNPARRLFDSGGHIAPSGGTGYCYDDQSQVEHSTGEERREHPVRPDVRIQFGSPKIDTYDKQLKHDDVVVVPELFGRKQNLTYFYDLVAQLQKIQECEAMSDVKAANVVDSEMGQAVQMIRDRLCQYFNVDKESARVTVDLQKDSGNKLELHRDLTENHNITIQASFGETRELAFLRNSKDKCSSSAASPVRLHFSQPNNTVISFGRDVKWKHGVNCILPANGKRKGTVVLVLRGFAKDAIDEQGSPQELKSDLRELPAGTSATVLKDQNLAVPTSAGTHEMTTGNGGGSSSLGILSLKTTTTAADDKNLEEELTADASLINDSGTRADRPDGEPEVEVSLLNHAVTGSGGIAGTVRAGRCGSVGVAAPLTRYGLAISPGSFPPTGTEVEALPSSSDNLAVHGTALYQYQQAVQPTFQQWQRRAETASVDVSGGNPVYAPAPTNDQSLAVTPSPAATTHFFYNSQPMDTNLQQQAPQQQWNMPTSSSTIGTLPQQPSFVVIRNERDINAAMMELFSGYTTQRQEFQQEPVSVQPQQQQQQQQQQSESSTMTWSL